MIEHRPSEEAGAAQRRRFSPTAWARGSIGDGVLVAIGWFGMTELIRLNLTVFEWSFAWLTWLCVLKALEFYFARFSRRWGGVMAVAAALGAMATRSHFFGHPLTGGQTVYAMGLGVTICAVWRLWRIPEGVSSREEIGRRITVAVGSLLLVYPFFTDKFIGGVDARWYVFMLTDFIEQARAGVFPVFVGAGEHAYVGAIHPFRSAPIYMWLAGAWDGFTLQSLSVIALQHLTVLTATLTAGLGLYAALVKGVSVHRNWAAAIALLYVLSPGVIGSLVCSDMYMTYLVAAALPAVIYGNASIVRGAEREGWRALAAGLVLAWMCHPPTGLLATLASASVQILWLAVAESPGERLKSAWRGGLWFAGLGVYYFYSMSEVPGGAAIALRHDALFFAGLALVIFGVMQVGLYRKTGYGLSVLAGGILLGSSLSPWLWWAGFFLVAGGCVAKVKGSSPPTERPRGIVFWILLAGLLSAAAAWWVVGKTNPLFNLGAWTGLGRYAEHELKFFGPLSPALNLNWDVQPGAAVWILLAVALAVSARVSTLSAGLFASAALFVAVAIVRIPGVSDFIVGYAPQGVSNIINLPLATRMMPVVAIFSCAAGFFALRSVKGRATTMAVSAALALGLFWSGWEARYYFQREINNTSARASFTRRFLPENAIMDRFVYDLLAIPAYYSHGKTDPWLDLRLLDSQGKVSVGLDEIAKQLEKENAAQILTLTCEADTSPEHWPKISPSIWVQPGEKLLLRFEFENDKDYTGYLIFMSVNDDYREYIMPESGMGAAFGVPPGHSKVLSLWNSTSQPVEYKLSFIKKGRNDLGVSDSRFARVYLSKYRTDSLPLQIESFLPFRARARLDRTGLLETPRYYLPGYEATVDKKPAPIESSRQNLAAVRLGEGEHEVELRYVGTWKLWLAAGVSAATWAALLGFLWRERRAARLNSV